MRATKIPCRSGDRYLIHFSFLFTETILFSLSSFGLDFPVHSSSFQMIQQTSLPGGGAGSMTEAG
jgi:hypothetical protein